MLLTEAAGVSVGFVVQTYNPRQCPAYGTKCDLCGKQNHFRNMCYKNKERKKSSSHHSKHRRRQSPAPRKPSPKEDSYKKTVNSVESEHNLSYVADNVLDCGEIVVHVVSAEERQSIFAKLNVRPPGVKQKVTLKVKADTGANGNILPRRCLEQMYPNTEDRRTKLRINNVKLTAVNGTDIPQIGFIDMPVQFENSEWVNTRFYICQTDGPAIFFMQRN